MRIGFFANSFAFSESMLTRIRAAEPSVIGHVEYMRSGSAT